VDRQPALISSVVQYAADSLEREDVHFGFLLCSYIGALECVGLIVSYECSSINLKLIYTH
jgi:hypothetical protein